MVFDDIRRCDEHGDVDFADEAELLKFVRKSRWVSVNIGQIRLFRINVRSRRAYSCVPVHYLCLLHRTSPVTALYRGVCILACFHRAAAGNSRVC